LRETWPIDVQNTERALVSDYIQQGWGKRFLAKTMSLVTGAQGKKEG